MGIVGILSLLIFLQGCVGGLEQNTMRSANKNIIEHNKPYEYILVKETSETRFYSDVKLRGEIGRSITKNSKILEDDVMGSIFEYCGYYFFDLLEIRIEPSGFPVFQEVWVFKDDKSEMEDKTTALGIVMEVLPNNSGTNFFLRGECPAAPRTIIFQKPF